MIEAFVRYAAEFEHAYASRDFARLAPFFTEDAEYEIHAPGLPTQVHRGRDAVLDYLEWVTEHFDQRFASREIVRLAGPTPVEDGVEVHGMALYTLDEGERCHLTMTERAVFEGGRISRLVDTITPGGACEIRWIVERHPERFPQEILGSVS